MTPDELNDCYVPLSIRWRHVKVGDVIAGQGGRLIAVESRGGRGGQMAVHLHGWDHPFLVDPDETVQVLYPVPMAQAMRLTREQLGARLLEQREDSAA